MGFTINKYNKCVANKMINGKQCTIAWYVDDVKISHTEQSVIDKIVSELKVEFGDLKITNGTEHDYLRMKIKLRKDKKIELSMKDQLLDAIECFGEDLVGTVSSPAKKGLFDVIEDETELDTEKSETFHSVSAKLLYLTKRARPDI